MGQCMRFQNLVAWIRCASFLLVILLLVVVAMMLYAVPTIVQSVIGFELPKIAVKSFQLLRPNVIPLKRPIYENRTVAFCPSFWYINLSATEEKKKTQRKKTKHKICVRRNMSRKNLENKNYKLSTKSIDIILSYALIFELLKKVNVGKMWKKVWWP